MDKNEFKAVAERLAEVNEVLAKLDPAIRVTAYGVLEPYVVSGAKSVVSRHPGKPAAAKVHTAGKPKDDDGDSLEDLEDEVREFLDGKDTNEPSDSVQALAAFLYHKYGTSLFSLKDIRKLGDMVGLTMPERVDMTLKGSMKNGKALFAAAGKGKYRVSVPGEAALKGQYGVKKGTSKRV